MYLVKRIVEAIQTSNYNNLSESEIKVLVKKAKRDYGTTNNTLRRLCDHGVLSRSVGVCKSSRRPSWLYSMNMTNTSVAEYIAKQEAKMEAARQEAKQHRFRFGAEYTVGVQAFEGPLIIGNGMAPAGKELECLIVSDKWEMVTEDYKGTKMIYFTKKKY